MEGEGASFGFIGQLVAYVFLMSKYPKPLICVVTSRVSIVLALIQLAIIFWR